MSSFREEASRPEPPRTLLPAESSRPGWRRLFSIERVVALLTPAFSAAGGWLSVEVATLVGVRIPREWFTAIFITGALVAAAASLKWLHGRSKWAAQVMAATTHELSSIGIPVAALESALRAHEQTIIDAIGKSVHAPPGAEELALEIVRQLWPQHAPTAAPETAHAA